MVSARLYRDTDAESWDRFLRASAQGTFLHSRYFLSYHGARFTDRSLVFEDDQGALLGVLPAAQSPEDPTCIVSHPGATYGGLVHLPRCSPQQVHAMLQAARHFLGGMGYEAFVYKAVPSPVQATCVHADVHALWLEGAKLVRRDLWNSVALHGHPHAARSHLRDVQKARTTGVIARPLKEEPDYAAFHGMLVDVLARHHARPVHSLADMLQLGGRFKDHIQLWGSVAADGELLAGIWLFKLHDACWHTQYHASSPRGRASCALDLLLHTIASEASSAGVRSLTMGSSTTAEGRCLNHSLFAFKSCVGAGSAVHDFYEIAVGRQ
jgi:hypothetical protein